MQLIIFVILAVFYALGSILKARADKNVKEERPPAKPEHKPPARGKGIPRVTEREKLERFLLKQLQGPETGKQARPQAMERRAGPEVQPPRRKVARPAKARPAVASPRRAERKPRVKTEEATEYLAEILSDYEDPEKLRRAILHYEILGKPISLRDPAGHS